MFFLKSLSAELQQEWDGLVKDSNFEAEWEKYKLNLYAVQLRILVAQIAELIKTRNATPLLGNEIISVMRNELEKYKYSNDSNMVSLLLQKIECMVELNGLEKKKRHIICLVGQKTINNWKLTDSIYSAFFNLSNLEYMKSNRLLLSGICGILWVAGLYFENFKLPILLDSKAESFPLYTMTFEMVTILVAYGGLCLLDTENIDGYLHKEIYGALKCVYENTTEKLHAVERMLEQTISISQPEKRVFMHN